VLVSSHLMSEMAQTADRLIIIGRGRLLADTPTERFVDASARRDVLVRSPGAGELAGLLAAAGAAVAPTDDGRLAVTGLESAAIGDLAAAHGIAVHELIPRHASLEQAYLDLTSFASFLLAQAVLSGHHRGLSLSHPGVTGAVLAAGALLCVSAVAGLGLGAIVRHVAGAVAALVGLIYLLGLACLFLPSPWDDRIGRFTVALAAYQVVALHPERDLLSPALSMLVLLAWPAAVLLAAGLLITRRDA
jgi:hypothetical protein